MSHNGMPMGMTTRKELQSIYNCSPKTLRKYLDAAGISRRNIITPHDLEILKKIIGAPSK